MATYTGLQFFRGHGVVLSVVLCFVSSLTVMYWDECCRQLAEKRKALLDELAIKYQQENHEHREQIKTMTAKHDSQDEQLNKQINELTVSMSQSPPIRSVNPSLFVRIRMKASDNICLRSMHLLLFYDKTLKCIFSHCVSFVAGQFTSYCIHR